MLSRSFPLSKEKPPLTSPFPSLLTLLIFLILFILFNHSSTPSLLSQSSTPTNHINSKKCNYSDGKWIYHPDTKPKYDNVKEIFKGWNCISGKKKNGLEIVKWRWKPDGCDLKLFDPLMFL